MKYVTGIRRRIMKQAESEGNNWRDNYENGYCDSGGASLIPTYPSVQKSIRGSRHPGIQPESLQVQLIWYAHPVGLCGRSRGLEGCGDKIQGLGSRVTRKRELGASSKTSQALRKRSQEKFASCRL